MMFFIVACSVYAGDDVVLVAPPPVCPEGYFPLEEMCVTQEQNDKVLAASEDIRPILTQEIRVQQQLEQAITLDAKLDTVLKELEKRKKGAYGPTP